MIFKNKSECLYFSSLRAVAVRIREMFTVTLGLTGCSQIKNLSKSTEDGDQEGFGV